MIFYLGEMQQTSSKLSQQENRYISYRNLEINKLSFDYPRSNNDYINLSPQSLEEYKLVGEDFLSNQKVAVIIFAGGMGNRAEARDGKQFISFGYESSLRGSTTCPGCIFDIVYRQTMEKAQKKRWNVVFYIICNKANRNNVLTRVEEIQQNESRHSSHQKAQIYYAFQQQNNLMSHGKETIYSKGNQKLMYPNGMGTFLEAKLYFGEHQQITLYQHMKSVTNPAYVYGVGTSNVKESGIDPALIGYLQKNHDVHMTFKCVETSFMNDPGPRITFRILDSKKKEWLIMDYKNLSNLTKSMQPIDKSPIWINNFAIDAEKLFKNKERHDNSELKYQFNKRVLKNLKGDKCDVVISEYLLSRTIMNTSIISKGILCDRKTQYHQLVTLDDFQILFKKLKNNTSIIRPR